MLGGGGGIWEGKCFSFAEDCYAGLAALEAALPLWFSWTLLMEPGLFLLLSLLEGTGSTDMEVNSEFKSVFAAALIKLVDTFPTD